MSIPTIPAADPEAELRRRASRRVALKTGWLVHAAVFVAVNALLWALNAWGGGAGHRWHVWPLGGWGIGLAIHGLVVLVALRGEGLRERMIDSEMRRLRERGPGHAGR